MITSTSNVQMKEITALLKKSKERKEKKAFVIEGRKMFEEICQDKTKVIKAYFAESYVNAGYAEEAMKEVPYEIVADSVFNSMAETVTPQGVLAIVRMPEYSLEDMISDAGTLVLLENLRDPGNLGTIIRTAEAAGVESVLALLSPYIMKLFTDDPELIKTVTILMWIDVALEIGRCSNLVFGQALKTSGDALFTTILGAIFMFLCAVGGTYLFGIKLELLVIGAYIGLAADECFRAVGMFFRWKSGIWRHKRLITPNAETGE